MENLTLQDAQFFKSIGDDTDSIKPFMKNDLMDITEHMKACCDALSAKNIIKDPSFNLFEGTHSLEINNEKLDSSMIKLSKQEWEFDCNSVQGPDGKEMETVTAIIDKLLRYAISWLNDYQTLPTTVLSCRYVEDKLTKYGETDSQPCLQTGNQYFDEVLDSAILGVCYFTGFVKNLVQQGIIIEEEDLNFNAMGIITFDKLPSQEIVLSKLERSLLLIDKSSESTRGLLSSLLNIIKCLVQINKIAEEYCTDVSFLEKLVMLVQDTSKLRAEMALQVPEGVFSQYIQRTRSNPYPPRQLIEPPQDNYEGLIQLSYDIQTMLQIETVDGIYEMEQFCQNFNVFKQRHVLSRALLFLFIVRKDGTILGKFPIEELIMHHISHVSGSKYCSNYETFYEKVQECYLDDLIGEANDLLLEHYQNKSQNWCRYRQGLNRHIILWDSLQAKLDSTSLSNVQLTRIADAVAPEQKQETEEFIVSLKLWSCHMKLNAMIAFPLCGFATEVYQPYEAFSVYWVTAYFLDFLSTNIQELISLNESHIMHLRSMHKKLKKLKAGAKKDELRQKYKDLLEHQAPIWERNCESLKLEEKMCHMQRSLCMAQTLHCGILCSYGVLEFLPKFAHASPELLHGLRFKSFSSIGVPSLPTFEVSQKSLQTFIAQKSNFESSLELLQSNLSNHLSEARRDLEEMQVLKLNLQVNRSKTGKGIGAEFICRDNEDFQMQFQASIHELQGTLVSNTSTLRQRSTEPCPADSQTPMRVSWKYSLKGARSYPTLIVS